MEEHVSGEGYRLAEGLEVTTGDTWVVPHVGLALLRALASSIGLTAGVSKALASRRVVVHDGRRVIADLACAIADGTEVISNFRVMADQGEVFGLVASVPMCWRALAEIAARRGRAKSVGDLCALVTRSQLGFAGVCPFG